MNNDAAVNPQICVVRMPKKLTARNALHVFSLVYTPCPQKACSHVKIGYYIDNSMNQPAANWGLLAVRSSLTYHKNACHTCI